MVDKFAENQKMPCACVRACVRTCVRSCVCVCVFAQYLGKVTASRYYIFVHIVFILRTIIFRSVSSYEDLPIIRLKIVAVQIHGVSSLGKLLWLVLRLGAIAQLQC